MGNTSPMHAVTELLPPRYDEPRPIGRGGMGEIYLARDTALDRPVAIKLLDSRFAEDEDVRSRFTREALAAARLSRAPSTVTIFDVGEWKDRPFIVMEYLAGGSLAERLENEGPQPPRQVVEWIEQSARALDAAHAAGVVHRDVKPGNLLLDERGCVHVADFGIASAVGLDSNTAVGTILGTAGYLAPEQGRGERATPATDRYALAAVAFELLTGSRPFERDNPTAEAAAHISDAIPSAARLNQELPSEVDPVIARGLAKAPADRYETAFEFAHALRESLEYAGSETRAIPVVSPPFRGSPGARRSRRNRWPLAFGALALLGAGIAGAAVIDRDGGGEQQVQQTATQPPRAQTVTVTAEGRTQTVVTTAPAAPVAPPDTQPAEQPTEEEAAAPPATTAAPAATGESAVELSDRGRDLIREGRYQEAIPPIERSLQLSAGTGWLVEAYASYNLAFARMQVGRCDGIPALLDRSEAIQGPRAEITNLRNEYAASCGG